MEEYAPIYLGGHFLSSINCDMVLPNFNNLRGQALSSIIAKWCSQIYLVGHSLSSIIATWYSPIYLGGRKRLVPLLWLDLEELYNDSLLYRPCSTQSWRSISNSDVYCHRLISQLQVSYISNMFITCWLSPCVLINMTRCEKCLSSDQLIALKTSVLLTQNSQS